MPYDRMNCYILIMFGDLGTLLPIQNTTYSLEGDDLIIASLLRERLKNYPSKESIFYLDVGASHPREGSNTFLFYQSGFRGICVEPLPELAALHREMRPLDELCQGCISDLDGNSSFTIFEDSSTSSMDEQTVARYSRKFKTKQQITVPTFTIDSLIKTLSLDSIANIPLLSVDCEGLDFKVVSAALNSRISFDLIVIEDKLVSFSTSFPSTEISRLLYSEDYRLMAKTPLNSFYVRQSSEAFSWLPSAMF